MNVNSMIKKRRVSNALESLENIKDQLSSITLPLKRSFDKKGRKKKELLSRVNDLTSEVESIISMIAERKNAETIKLFSRRALEIVNEKEKIESELLSLKGLA